jgi:hypothetical protein
VELATEQSQENTDLNNKQRVGLLFSQYVRTGRKDNDRLRDSLSKLQRKKLGTKDKWA